MEAALQQQMDAVAGEAGVQGVVMADPLGLCMAVRGTFMPESSGHAQALIDLGSKLSEDGELPIVHVQTNKSEILIAHADGYTTAVQRTSNFTHQSWRPPQQHQQEHEQEVAQPREETSTTAQTTQQQQLQQQQPAQ